MRSEKVQAGHWWLKPVVLAPQEAEIKTAVQSQPWANSSRDPISEQIHHQKQLFLPLEPLRQPLFCDGVFRDSVSELFAQAGFILRFS
jgi:hypothetical protein